MDNTVINLKSVQDYCHHLGITAQHPLVSIVDMGELPFIRHAMKCFGFYAVYYKELECGTLLYGRSKYDYEEGTMVFVGPNQVVGQNDGSMAYNPKGLILMFHPNLLHGTTLVGRMKEYSFFSYDNNEALHMSEREKLIVLKIFREIQEELNHNIDKHTKHIVCSNIETLLNHCIRFYDRQFVTREIANENVISRLDFFLSEWFNTPNVSVKGLPTVKDCASAVCLSANYFGDLVKKFTGHTAIEHIHLFALDRAKELLTETSKPVSEIAYQLGFNYPHHLTRLFKKHFNITPIEYRATAN